MRVLAVDLGATSIRVVAVDLALCPPEVEVLHRFGHLPVRHQDHSLRWDWERVIAEVVIGLEKGLARGPVNSIGVDAWGVDYGLVDEAGELIAAPFSYRSNRTASWADFAERIGHRRLFEMTGIQRMAINTLFQLEAHDRHELERANRLLMLPELVVHALTGAVTAERTSAGTTSLVDICTGGWSAELIAAVGIDSSLFSPIEPPGTAVGEWHGVPVHLVGGHDTASAIAAAPIDPTTSTAFISSGTWLLVGVEASEPNLSEAAFAHNFSNEPAVEGGVRLLKNVMGLWMLEQCRMGWTGTLAEILAAAAALPAGGSTVDATHDRFLAPSSMEAEVRAAANLDDDSGPDIVARCVLDSLALATASVVDELNAMSGGEIEEIVVVGGGAQNSLLNELIAVETQTEVRAGPVEATALGNALVQGVALGMFGDLAEARAAVA